MATILNHVADLFFWGSIAVISWGAALAVGHWLASVEVRDPPPARRSNTERTPGHAPRAAD
jgi:hypothetical protein